MPNQRRRAAVQQTSGLLYKRAEREAIVFDGDELALLLMY
jgi:hypothetical protein